MTFAATVPALFDRFIDRAATGKPGFLTNWLGLRTRTSLFPHAASLDGEVHIRHPFPSDGIYGGATEYAVVLTAIEQRRGARFRMVEMGSAWAPWASLAAFLCKREGVEDVSLVAVEASAERYQAMLQHLAENGVADVVRPVFGAAWSEDCTLRFPDVAPTDHGGAASSGDAGVATDYRGLHMTMTEVPAFSVSTLCEGLGEIDLLHIDIQGAELEVVSASLDFLNANVRRVFIGTHSRAIEGQLIPLMISAGWILESEQPCAFVFDASKPSLEGMTTSDGEQYWVNPRL